MPLGGLQGKGCTGQGLAFCKVEIGGLVEFIAVSVLVLVLVLATEMKKGIQLAVFTYEHRETTKS